MREPGYYWVKNDIGQWEIARFVIPPTAPSGRFWIFTSATKAFRDIDFLEINEARIIPPDGDLSNEATNFVMPTITNDINREIRSFKK